MPGGLAGSHESQQAAGHAPLRERDKGRETAINFLCSNGKCADFQGWRGVACVIPTASESREAVTCSRPSQATHHNGSLTARGGGGGGLAPIKQANFRCCPILYLSLSDDSAVRLLDDSQRLGFC